MDNKNRFKVIFFLAIIFIFVILFIYANKCFALNPKIITFEKTYGGPGNDVGSSVQQTIDEGYIVVGTTGMSDTSGYLYLIKTDKFGKLLWQKKFGDLGEMTGSCVRQTFDRGYIITGTIGSIFEENYHVCLIKTDTHGNLQWQKFLEGILTMGVTLSNRHAIVDIL